MKLSTKLWVDYYVGSAMHVLLKPLVIALGRTLRRDHDLGRCSDIAFVKLLGGGSLVIAYPMLLALRRKPSVRRLRLVATPATAAFARTLGVFDEILVVRDHHPLLLLADTFRVIRRLWRTDALVDLEIHSRLTTVMCLLTAARNRVGFFTEVSFWRRDLSTHLLFCHPGNPIFRFYDQIAALFDAPLPTSAEAGDAFRAALAPGGGEPRHGARVVGVAPCCSDLGRERMLEVAEWVSVLAAEHRRLPIAHALILGGSGDVETCGALTRALASALPDLRVEDASGRHSLEDSVRRLASVDRLYAIDSGLLHFARLLGVPTTSWWGPTAPATRLRPSDSAADQVHYAQLPCSPCVHIVASPPCRGDNICMRLAVDPSCGANRNPPWLAQGKPARSREAAGPDGAGGGR